jgi:bleomycin hydrolase
MPLTGGSLHDQELIEDMRGITKFVTSASNHAVSAELLKCMRTQFRASPKNVLAMNAGTRNEIKDIVISRSRPVDTFSVYSHRLPQEAKATNQKSSGRCWLFAALNVLRLDLIKRYNLGDDFEFSQNYLAWHDKLEKSNWFLENVVRTAGEPLDGRLVQFLLTAPVQDGGQWDMAVSLIEKYGLVPKNIFPETSNSGSTAQLNALLTRKLREWSFVLRGLVDLHGASSPKIAEVKDNMMAQVYRMLSIALGEPPLSFDWCFRDKDKKYMSFTNLTPQTFFRDHVATKPCGQSPDVCIVKFHR